MGSKLQTAEFFPAVKLTWRVSAESEKNPMVYEMLKILLTHQRN